MLLNERDERHQHLLNIARQMMTAARTAPKAKGVDIIEIAVVEGDDCRALSSEMEAYGNESGLKFFLRDAGNIRDAEFVMLIGTKELPHALNCGYCGAEQCATRGDGVPCAINSIDVGIALGSACAAATDARVDTRVMFSAGLAAQRLGLLGDDVHQVIAIAVAASSKNPFFDRKPKH